MPQQKKLLGLISICLLLICGCYESKVPLSLSDKSRIDERLVKCWLELPQNKNDKPYRVAICKFNDHEYLVTFSNDPSNPATLARGFTTTINDITIMNLQGIESFASKDRTFVFFKYAVAANGNLRAWMLADDSPLLKNRTFSTQAEFYNFIKKNIHNEKLYSPVREFKAAQDMRLEMVF